MVHTGESKNGWIKNELLNSLFWSFHPFWIEFQTFNHSVFVHPVFGWTNSLVWLIHPSMKEQGGLTTTFFLGLQDIIFRKPFKIVSTNRSRIFTTFVKNMCLGFEYLFVFKVRLCLDFWYCNMLIVCFFLKKH